MNNIPQLSPDGLVCTINDTEIKCDQNIDYKSATSSRTSMGKVLRFTYAGWKKQDKSSVWMLVKDIQDNSTEWISVYVWKTQVDRGIFGKPKIVKNVSEEPPVIEGRPF